MAIVHLCGGRLCRSDRRRAEQSIRGRNIPAKFAQIPSAKADRASLGFLVELDLRAELRTRAGKSTLPNP